MVGFWIRTVTGRTTKLQKHVKCIIVYFETRSRLHKGLMTYQRALWPWRNQQCLKLFVPHLNRYISQFLTQLYIQNFILFRYFFFLRCSSNGEQSIMVIVWEILRQQILRGVFLCVQQTQGSYYLSSSPVVSVALPFFRRIVSMGSEVSESLQPFGTGLSLPLLLLLRCGTHVSVVFMALRQILCLSLWLLWMLLSCIIHQLVPFLRGLDVR